MKINPSASEAYTGLGFAAYRQGDYAKALVAFRRVTELKPADASAHLNLGLAYTRRNQDTDALASCKRAVTINPKLTAGWISIAQLELKANKSAPALAASLKAVGLETTALAVAGHYGARSHVGGLIDGWLIDTTDAASVEAIESLGIRCRAVPLLMTDLDATRAMAIQALSLADLT